MGDGKTFRRVRESACPFRAINCAHKNVISKLQMVAATAAALARRRRRRRKRALRAQNLSEKSLRSVRSHSEKSSPPILVFFFPFWYCWVIYGCVTHQDAESRFPLLLSFRLMMQSMRQRCTMCWIRVRAAVRRRPCAGVGRAAGPRLHDQILRLQHRRFTEL